MGKMQLTIYNSSCSDLWKTPSETDYDPPLNSQTSPQNHGLTLLRLHGHMSRRNDQALAIMLNSLKVLSLISQKKANPKSVCELLVIYVCKKISDMCELT